MKNCFLWISVLSAVPGCAWLDEVGKDKEYGTMELVSEAEDLNDELKCAAQKFPLKFWEFDADEPIENNVRIRMYESLATPILRNFAAINFVDMDSETGESCPPAADLVGQTLDVSPNGCVRAQVQINTCSKPQTLNVIGKVTLSSYSIERRGWMEGTIDGTLVYSQKVTTTTETREYSTEVGTMTGKFAFVIHAGAIWEK